MNNNTDRPLSGLTSAVEEFVNEMEAVRELLDKTSTSIVSLDDRQRAVLDHLAGALPQTTESQRQQAFARWEVALDKLSEINNRSADREETEDDRTEGIEAVRLAGNEIDNLLDRPRGFVHVLGAWREAVDRPRRAPLLRAALLTTAVSGFEVLIARLARHVIALRPEILRSSEAKYSMADVEGFADLDEFREYCADRQVDSLMFGGLDDWMTWIKKQLKIDWSDFTGDAASFREVFQRRHLVVHNGGVVNRQYLLKMAGTEKLPPIGSRLLISKSYCEDSIDLLTQSGVRLGLRVIRKLDKQQDEAERSADQLCSTITFRFLKKEQNRSVIDVITNELELCTDNEFTQIMRVNCWIARKETEGLSSIRDEVLAWQTSALASRYELAKLALLDRNEEALALGVNLRAKGEVSIEDWLTWPLLKGVREHEITQEQERTKSKY